MAVGWSSDLTLDQCKNLLREFRLHSRDLHTTQELPVSRSSRRTSATTLNCRDECHLAPKTAADMRAEDTLDWSRQKFAAFPLSWRTKPAHWSRAESFRSQSHQGCNSHGSSRAPDTKRVSPAHGAARSGVQKEGGRRIFRVFSAGGEALLPGQPRKRPEWWIPHSTVQWGLRTN
jgi:hypothetical protein